MSEWKETEFGFIPHDWQVVRFKELLKTPLRNGVNKPSRVRGMGDYKMVNMNEIFAYDVITDIPMEFVDLSEKERETSLLEKYDLLFARQSLVFEGAGKCSIYLGDNEKICFEGHLIRARLNKQKVNPEFYYYFFSSSHGKRFLRTIIEQAVVAGIRGSDLKELEIPYAPKTHQDGAVELLSCLDRKIENLRKQNETLEQIAQTLFKHWFVDFEFPNADGKPYKSSGGEMVPSELGDIPAGWRVEKLGDEFDITMGQSPAGSSYNEEGEGLIFFQGRTDFGFRFPQVRLFTTEPKRIANKLDVLVSVRAPVGDINVAFERCCIGRGLSAVSSKYKSYCLYKLKSYRKFFDVFETEGTVFGSLNKQNFNDLESIIPNAETVEFFDSTISPLDKKIFLNERQIQTLTRTRDELLPKLMSGKLRITS